MQMSVSIEICHNLSVYSPQIGVSCEVRLYTTVRYQFTFDMYFYESSEHIIYIKFIFEIYINISLKNIILYIFINFNIDNNRNELFIKVQCYGNKLK